MLVLAAASSCLAAEKLAPAADLPALIRQLGAPEFAERDAASARILDLALADPAEIMTALRTAQNAEGADPEVQSRCQALIRRIPLEGVRRKAYALAPADGPFREALEALLAGPDSATIFTLAQAAKGKGLEPQAAAILALFLDLEEEALGTPAVFSGAGGATDDTNGSSGGGPAPPLHMSILSAMGMLADKSQAARVARFASHADEQFRVAACYALGQIRAPSTGEALLPLLEDPFVSVRCAAVYALGQIGERKAAARLVELVKGDPATRGAAAAALAAIGDRSIVPRIVSFLDEPDVPLRCAAISLLGQLKERTVCGRLADLLGSEDAALRGASVGALAQIGDTSVLEKADALLADDDRPDVRLAACTLFVSLRDASTSKRLLALFSDPDARIRGQAAWGLAAQGGALKDEAVTTRVAALLDDEDANVRGIAANLLQQVSGQQFWKEGGTTEDTVLAAKEWWKKRQEAR